MRLGIDDTDSPSGMCTTYLGAVVARRLARSGIPVGQARLVRLNPNVPWKTRGNAAVCLEFDGDGKTAFGIACSAVDELAEHSCDGTNPGVVVTGDRLPPWFYQKAVSDFCKLEEAEEILEHAGALYRGWGNKRGLIGATAAAASEFSDSTWEILSYRKKHNWGIPRLVDRESLFAAEEATYPHTWDTVDRACKAVVCVPHTPDPVLFGIRGESPQWVMKARSMIHSEDPAFDQLWVTNQGTDAHLVAGRIGSLEEGRSYTVCGIVAAGASSGPGGHVSIAIMDPISSAFRVDCLAFEPTKDFRGIVRGLLPGDRILAAGSYKRGSINLEKLCIVSLVNADVRRPPPCTICGKRMTSAGKGKGFKCRTCRARETEPEIDRIDRTVRPGWYEVPPVARRHLAKPLCRNAPLISGLPNRDERRARSEATPPR